MTTFTLYHRAEIRARSLFILIRDDIRYRFRFIVNSVIRSVGSKENRESPCFPSKSCLTRVTIEKEDEKRKENGVYNKPVGSDSVSIGCRCNR